MQGIYQVLPECSWGDQSLFWLLSGIGSCLLSCHIEECQSMATVLHCDIITWPGGRGRGESHQLQQVAKHSGGDRTWSCDVLLIENQDILLSTLSRLSTVCSFHIFNSLSWDSNKLEFLFCMFLLRGYLASSCTSHGLWGVPNTPTSPSLSTDCTFSEWLHLPKSMYLGPVTVCDWQ